MKMTKEKVIRNTDGFLECTVCGDSWCNHIEKFIKLGLDADDIWSSTDASIVVVPLVPTAGCYAIIQLEPVDESVAKGFIVLDDVLAPSSGAANSKEFLGMFNKGDGRIVMRDALVSFVEPRFYTSTPKCMSKSHGYDREMTLKRSLKSRSGRIAQGYSFITSGLCLACLEGKNAWSGSGGTSSATDSDLIPS